MIIALLGGKDLEFGEFKFTVLRRSSDGALPRLKMSSIFYITYLFANEVNNKLLILRKNSQQRNKHFGSQPSVVKGTVERLC